MVVRGRIIVTEVLRQAVLAADLRVRCAEQIERANRCGGFEEGGILHVVDLLGQHQDACKDSLLRHDGDYRILIRMRNSRLGIVIDEKRRDISIAARPSGRNAGYDVVCTKYLVHLRWALTRGYGDARIR